MTRCDDTWMWKIGGRYYYMVEVLLIVRHTIRMTTYFQPLMVEPPIVDQLSNSAYVLEQ